MAVRAGKLRPARLPKPLVPRPRLDEIRDDARTRRVTVLTGGAGTGKSTVAACWVEGVRSAWYTAGREDEHPVTLAAGLVAALGRVLPGLDPATPPAVDAARGPGSDEDDPARAAAIGAALAEAVDAAADGEPVWLVLDDPDGALGVSAPVLDALVHQGPPELSLLVLSRTPPPLRLGRLRASGEVLDVPAGQLAFGSDEVRAVLDQVAGAGAVADAVVASTGGWPALVRLTAEALRGVSPGDRDRVLAGLAAPDSSVAAYLLEEVLGDDRELGGVLSRLAALGPFRPAAARSLGIADLDALAGRGLVRVLEPDLWAVPDVVSGALATAAPLPADERRQLLHQLAVWTADAGEPAAALAVAARGLSAGAVLELLAHPALADGPTTGASARTLLETLDAVALTGRREVAALEGQARQLLGDWDGALRCYVAAAGSAAVPAGLAWRIALVHVYRRDLDAAVEVRARATTAGSTDGDVARLESWAASAHWFRGDPDAARDAAGRSMAAAVRAAEPGPLAAAHVALALVAAAEGQRAANTEHYRRALAHAVEAGETLLELRVRVNLGSAALEQGEFLLAESQSSAAVTLAELAGYDGLRVVALVNRAHARSRLGRLEEALHDLETARGLAGGLGPGMTAYPLAGIGDLHRLRGDVVLAKAAYTAAVAAAEPTGDVQSLSTALTGLARLQVDDDPALALVTADRAAMIAPGTLRASALVSAAWVAHSAQASPQTRLDEAERLAEATNDRWSLAEALELRAALAPPGARRRARLEQAHGIWAELGDPVALARVELALAQTRGAVGRVEEAVARRRLSALGVRPGAAASAAGLLRVVAPDTPPVQVLALGGLRVLRHGLPVPAGEWQSKKARDLLKLLVVRRGRPAPREWLMEALWPDDDPDRIANRLSVLLSTLRAVLDPERVHAPEHFVAGDKAALTLDLGTVQVDVEDFLAEAAVGLHGLADDPRTAVVQLSEAEARCAGELFEDDPYAEWVGPLREEVRATYATVVRALRAQAAADGDTDLAVRYCLRLLERDPYDEEGHLALVLVLHSADRHGEARRRYRFYAERMAELGVDASPFPGTSARSRRRAG